MKDAVNEVRVDSIKKLLSKLKRIIEYTPKDDAAEIEENKQIIDIVERILEIKKKNSISTRAKNTNTKQNAQQITNFFSSIKCRK